MQAKNDSGYCFGTQKVWCPNLTSLACLHCQKQLKIKTLIKDGMILILKFVFKKCCTAPIKNSSFKAKHIFLETKCKRSICLIYFDVYDAPAARHIHIVIQIQILY